MLLSRRRASTILLYSWLGFTVWAFWYTQFAPLIIFDQQGRVQTLTESPHSFAQQLRAALPEGITETGALMVHFYQTECRCRYRAARHIHQLQQLAAAQQLRNIEIDIGTHPALAALVPATPATLLLDADGELRYFGPYSSGVLCSSRNSLVENVLRQISTPHPGVMPMEVLGCYCPTQPSPT